MPLENDFDASFVTSLALREKQVQQSYRPLIGIHKWFAGRMLRATKGKVFTLASVDKLVPNSRLAQFRST